MNEYDVESIGANSAGAGSTRADVVVYWRPGCPFCAMLRSGLRRADILFSEVNIWDDPEAAAFVRSVARGNETVPTVRVGPASLVNPTARQVVEAIAAADGTPPPPTNRSRFTWR